ncbi:CMD domain-containing protein [Burkholderia plantarii]|uniref:CMD domain-containing protein n=1 Tax=Burkholderia plantarii TaxID=41899 RepID=UPI000870A1D9|nr:hypothetical protein [Burkholderia plantarii]
MSALEPGAWPDTIDQAAGLRADGPVAALRRAREKADRHTRGSEAALFDPALAGLPLAERLHAARQAAVLSRADALAGLYRRRLIEHEVAAGTAPEAVEATLHAIDEGDRAALPPRLSAIASHTRRLVAAPATASPADLLALRAAGLTTPAIVALSQLVAFVTYQARVAAACAALQAYLAPEAP